MEKQERTFRGRSANVQGMLNAVKQLYRATKTGAPASVINQKEICANNHISSHFLAAMQSAGVILVYKDKTGNSYYRWNKEFNLEQIMAAARDVTKYYSRTLGSDITKEQRKDIMHKIVNDVIHGKTIEMHVKREMQRPSEEPVQAQQPVQQDMIEMKRPEPVQYPQPMHTQDGMDYAKLSYHRMRQVDAKMDEILVLLGKK